MALLTGCGLFQGSTSPGLEKKVNEHDAEINTLRQDVTELQVKTGLRRPEGSMGAVDAVEKYTSSAGVASQYQRGRALFVKGRFEQAAEIFRRILAEGPTDKLAPNAGYWLGETYYSRAMYREAITEFQQTADRYPGHHKASDSLLKIAYSHHHLGEGSEAMNALHQLLTRYPKSRAAGMVKTGRTVFREVP